MPYTKEETREYNRQYNLKNKEKISQKQKEYREKNREKLKESDKQKYLKNKEKILQRNKEYKKEWRETPQGKKSHRITNWKQYGILCFDFDLLYDLFLKTTHCEYCDCELTTDRYIKPTTRCLDHDHSITDKFNIRGVLCNLCNKKDVLK